ncbi:tetratricopeptide repeat protein [Robiginitalea sp. M366]|uniref:tetratricopeptide repeat protein n=1 Tax=Robiginitalea aestuariiviva TaxID=3036903 RepID=UPI00240CEE9F|nr:tetratricopeptide repeat protein [Robiginitalea aestuariiviva]MDG1571100.1 tetratricopeptide repeat protein [Robiginitalea aestuariiviva]
MTNRIVSRFAVCCALVLLQQSHGQNSVTADSLFAVGDYDKAISAYSICPSARSELRIAQALAAMGKEMQAIDHYRQFCEKYPTRNVARYEWAKLLYRSKRLKEAREQINILVSTHPEHSEFQYYDGLLANNLGQTEKAISIWRNTVSRDSAHLRTLLQLGLAYLKRNQPDSAIFYSEMGIHSFPHHIGLKSLRAQALFNRDSFREAVVGLKSLIDAGEDKAYVWDKLGHSYLVLTQPDSARIAFKNLLEFDGREGDAYFGLARSYHQERKIDSAKNFYHLSILAKSPNLSNEYEALARIAQEGQDFEEALSYYRLLLKETGDNIRVEYQICACLDKTSETPQKIFACYDRFLDKYGNYENYFTATARRRLDQLRQEADLD